MSTPQEKLSKTLQGLTPENRLNEMLERFEKTKVDLIKEIDPTFHPDAVLILHQLMNVGWNMGRIAEGLDPAPIDNMLEL